MAEGMDGRCHREIEELHTFFARWLAGELPSGEEGLRRVREVLAEDFEIVTPSAAVLDRPTLLDSLLRGHGTRRSPPGFQIRVDGYRGRRVGPGLLLTRYREWQKEGDGFRGRLSSALFRDRAGTPNGVEWLHVHETWIP